MTGIGKLACLELFAFGKLMVLLVGWSLPQPLARPHASSCSIGWLVGIPCLLI